MPSYSYKCEVCSTRVPEGNDYCATCGCPAVQSAKELELFREKWEASDKSIPLDPVEPVEISKYPFCAYTSAGILLSWIWYFFIAPTTGQFYDLKYFFIALLISFPLGIAGVINATSRIRRTRSNRKGISSFCLVFSIITIALLLFPVSALLYFLFLNFIK